MPSLSVSPIAAIAADTGLLPAAAPANGKAGDGFDALLAIGTAGPDLDKNARAPRDERKNETRDPIAAPVSERTAPPHRHEKGDRVEARPEAPALADEIESPAAPAADKSAPAAKPEKSSRAEHAAAKAAAAEDSNEASDAEAMQAQIDYLEKTINALMQLLAQQLGLPLPQEGTLAERMQAMMDALAAQQSGQGMQPQSVVPGLLKNIGDIFAGLKDMMQSLQAGGMDRRAMLSLRVDMMGQFGLLEGNLEKLRKSLLPKLPAYLTDEKPNPAIDHINHALKTINALKSMVADMGPHRTAPVAADNALSADAARPEIYTGPVPESGKDKADTKGAAQAASVEARPAGVSVAAAPQAVAAATNGSGSTTAHNDNHAGSGGMPQPFLAVSAANSSPSQGAGSVSFARLLNPAQQAALTEQVTFHIKTALADGSSRIRIQLDPAELGRLEIRLHVNADGKTGVVITADNKDTLALLQRDARGLEQALNDAGLKTDSNSLSFNLREQQREHNQPERNYTAYPKTQEEEDEDMALAAISRSYVINLSEGLDIKI